MRVALLSRAVFPLHDPGGMERSVYHLARQLHRRGIDTVLYTRPATEPGSFPGEVVTVGYEDFPLGAHGRVLDRIVNYPRFALRLGGLVAAEVKAGRVDAVHAQGVAGLGYARRRAADPALRAPLLLNPQGMEEHKTRGLKRIALSRLRRLSRETARLADRVIATDEVTKDEVPHYLGVDPARVVVLPNGIDLEEIAEATPREPRTRVASLAPTLGASSPILISVGRLEPYKGFGDVLEALLLLHSRAALPEGWAWLVIGDGSERAVLQRRMAAWDQVHPGRAVTPRVHFLGWIRDNPTLHACYATADLFVHATHYEGSSIVTLEAMAHGLPVVATRAGGIPDKVLTGENGILVAPADVAALSTAIGSLSSDPEERRRMGEKSRERVARLFSWTAIAERTVEVYAEMLGGKVAAAPAEGGQPKS